MERLLSNSAYSRSEPCLDQLTLFSNPAGKPLTPCTQERLLVPGGPSERLWKAGAAITSAEGTTCWSGALASSSGTCGNSEDSVPSSLPPKRLVACGLELRPTPPPPCWALGGFSATLGYRSLGPLSSSQKSQGHVFLEPGAWWGQSHSQDLSFEHGGTPGAPPSYFFPK